MSELHEALAAGVSDCRAAGYSHELFGAVAVRITDMLGEEVLVVLPVAPDA